LRGAAVAGTIAGFIAAGIGSRVVMRVIFLFNRESDGVTTDASATVGDVSAGGTLGLLVLGSLAGVLGGVFYLGLRRWLPVPTVWRGLAFAVITLLTIGQILFDPANVDFQMFEPVLLVVALFTLLFFINGFILAPIADRIHPEPAYSAGVVMPRIVGGIIIIVSLLGFVVMADTVRTMVADSGSCFSARGGGQGCAVAERDLSP
jgi:hypothetical protein